MDEGDLADTVAAFYDGAASPELWPAAGKRLSRLLDAQLGVSRVGTAPSGLGELVFYLGPTPASPAQYAEHYMAIDPYLATVVAPAPLPVDARFGILGQQLVDQRAYRRGEFYADFGRGLGLGHLLGAFNRLGGGALATLALYRPEARAPFGEAERRTFAALMPHLWRALELRQRLRPRLDAAAAGLGALDALAQAVVVADAASRVTFANAAADRLAAAALAAMVGAVAERVSPGGALRLRRAAEGQDAPPLAVLVSPLPARLPTTGAGPGVAPGLALVIATDPSRPAVPSAEMLSGVFGLSAGEAAVACALAGGRSAEEVARTRGVGLETVRTQVRAVLGKTGAANLRDLERVLASLPSAAPPGP